MWKNRTSKVKRGQHLEEGDVSDIKEDKERFFEDDLALNLIGVQQELGKLHFKVRSGSL